MACIWSVFRSESRRRWPSWLALALLVALVGGTVLAATSTARRTSAAFTTKLRLDRIKVTGRFGSVLAGVAMEN